MKNKNNKRGFIKFIVLIIIILVIGQLLGYGPVDLWNKVIWPIALIGWKVILIIVKLIVEALRAAYGSVSNIPLTDLIKDLGK
jgi:carbon starvation protein CstA